jgi:hypothetical protein
MLRLTSAVAFEVVGICPVPCIGVAACVAALPLRSRFRRGLPYMPLACGNVLAGVWPGRVSGAAHPAKGAGHA